jgi:hypothetical protein
MAVEVLILGACSPPGRPRAPLALGTRAAEERTATPVLHPSEHHPSTLLPAPAEEISDSPERGLLMRRVNRVEAKHVAAAGTGQRLDQAGGCVS